MNGDLQKSKCLLWYILSQIPIDIFPSGGGKELKSAASSSRPRSEHQVTAFKEVSASKGEILRQSLF